MAIFPHIDLEAKVQENEKTRINCEKSFQTQDESGITLVRIRPDNTIAGWITIAQLLPTVIGDVNDNASFYLDWQYNTAGTYTAEVEITTDSLPVVASKDIIVVTELAEHLFSNDNDLEAFEPDILKYIKDGKNSYNDFHRSAQATIMDDIYRSRIFDTDGNKLTVADVLDVSELNPWAVNMVLNNIYQSLSNKTDDVFSVKSGYYATKAFEDRNRAMNQMRLDYNKDLALENTDTVDMRTIELVRR